MYSLLVSNLVEENFSSAIELDSSRFLEYTDALITNQLRNLSAEAIECLKAWPCLLMREGRGNEIAYLVQIKSIQPIGREINLTLSNIPIKSMLINDTLWKLREELDIADFEFSRNHWAIKDRNIFPILNNAGYQFKESDITKFEDKLFPAPNRRELLQAGKVIAEWSHTEIDDLLRETGITALKADRSIGGRKERANAIIDFALATPQAVTAENSLFTVYLIRHTSEVVANRPGGNTPQNFPAEPTALGQDRISSNRDPNRVFVVHGKNNSARTAVVSELTRLGLEAIVLHEQPNMGRHLLTKFIEEAKLVTFAVVLMTDDDLGSLKGEKLAPRARQNVILELGYFLSRLGQQKVCALITPGLETPSDFDGIVYISMDNEGNWKAELARELRAAGMPLIEKKI